MIPTPSTSPMRAEWVGRVRKRTAPLIDYEQGGIALNDPSQGLRGYDWTAIYDPGTQWVSVYREDQGPASAVPVLQRAGITRIGLAFDQNMRPHLCWTEPSGVYLWHYVSASAAMTATAIPDAAYPCLTLDDRRPGMIDNSDILLSYRSGGNLCVRVQREQYASEHVMGPAAGELKAAGMSKGLRMQWSFRPG